MQLTAYRSSDRIAGKISAILVCGMAMTSIQAQGPEASGIIGVITRRVRVLDRLRFAAQQVWHLAGCPDQDREAGRQFCCLFPWAAC